MKRGRGQQIRIDLYDTIENKYVLRDSGMPDAARHLKIPYKTFMNYIYKDKPVQGIYKVIKVGILPSKTYLAEQAAIERAIVKKRNINSRKRPYDFDNRWEDAVKPFRILSRRKKAAV